jgi:photosystem II stability/assembly factor-like uncharacterized protein
MKKLIFTLLIIHYSLLIANAQWVVVSDNSMYLSTQAFSDNGNNIYAAISGLGVFKTTNNGINWTSTGSNLTTQPFNTITAKDSFVFVASNYGLFRSTNYGLTFDSLTSNPGSALAVIIDNNFLFKGMLNGVYRSTDWGNTWVIVNNEIPGNYPAVTSLAFSNLTIYTGVDYGYDLKMFKSTNHGDNWTQIGQSEIPSNNIPYSLYAFDNLVLCGTGTGVYKTTNYGINWSLIPGISGNIGLFGFASVGAKNIFISAWNYGVYISNDYGETFTLKNEGLQSLRCTALYKFGNYLFLGTNPTTLPCKIDRRPLNEVIGINIIGSEIPNAYKLFQNYPNPFNPVTSIKYQVKSSKYIKINVFDISGKDVATLVNEKQSPGTYEVSFNGSNFASGVYFYRIQSGDFVQVKKMMLIK